MALSPMMQHYLATKQQNPDAILFYRLGDFYEMFFDDAVTVSRELELTLTGKECGLEERAPMAGVPWHSADNYIARLIEKGYKVAICEQMEDPATAKGLVKREVVRIVTPGTVIDLNQLKEKQNNYLCAVYLQARKAGVALCDLSTGEFFVRVAQEGKLAGILAAERPGEILTNDAQALKAHTDSYVQAVPAQHFAATGARDRLLKHFGVISLDALGLDRGLSPATAAAGALLKYLEDTQKVALPHITRLKVVAEDETMPLDAGTRRNLELTEGLRSRSAYGSLLWMLDRTVTAMGGRMLRAWVEQPLLSPFMIEERLDAVEALHTSPVLQEELLQGLRQVYDMERLLSKVSYRTLNARDCLSLLRSLNQAPLIRAQLHSATAQGLRNIWTLLDEVPDITQLLESAIHPDAPLVITEGGIIRDGYNQELDSYRAAASQGRQWLLDLETREREKTGIKNLKVQYNRVFGYHIEVTKSFYHLVPDTYVRRQTLANAERFTTEELKQIEEKVTGAHEKAVALESRLFDEVRTALRDAIPSLQRIAEGFKRLDALLSLARVALENAYVRPRINQEGTLHILEGRHPVVERTLKDTTFVPNDTDMDLDAKRMLIVTGPNMAGKSTYMRQTALIVLLAHIGAFVPAQEADIPLVDNIFTRIGASDDLAGGQSTFMVEMSELSYILRSATRNSLVILDEIGRGTSTFDGLSIAWATVEYLVDVKRSGAKTLFATHYHELSEMEGVLEGVQNYCVAVKEMGEEVIFLHKIVRGGADKSFGVYVARLAGVPRAVIARAKEIQARLEVSDINQSALAAGILEKNRRSEQVNLLDVGKTELVEEIANLDVLSMSPMDALNALFLLREKARKI